MAHGSTYIRPASRVYGPQVIIACYPETFSVRSPGRHGETVETLRAIHATMTRLYRGKWTDTEYHAFDDVQAFHDWLESDIGQGRKIHVFAPQVYRLLTLSDWWARVEESGWIHEDGMMPTLARLRESIEHPQPAGRTKPKRKRRPPPNDGRYRIRTFTASATTEILRYRVRGRSFQWATYGQYMQSPENEIARAIGWVDPERFGIDHAAGELTPLAAERSLLWCHFLRTLAKWWVQHRGGPWGPTTAACAYSWLRMRIAPRTVLQHDDTDAAALEERAIFGGRRSIWFAGNIGAPQDWREAATAPPPRAGYRDQPPGMLHCDIRSMYPFLLATGRFPVKLIEWKRDWSLPALSAAAVDHGIVAHVGLTTTAAEYPFRHTNGIRYPRGKFETILTGPELRLAFAAGEVDAVYEAAVYQLGRPFAAAAEPLLKLRSEFRDKGMAAWELFAKNLANSMTGKLGQKPFDMEPRPHTPAPVDWGWWSQWYPETGETRTFRTWAGCTYERVRAEGRIRPMGATYAYLTAYGRVMMRAIRDKAGPRGAYCQDTDGVWLTPEGAWRVYGGRPEETFAAGTLTVTRRATVGRFWGPQHYWFGDGWILSGVCLSGGRVDAEKIVTRERPNPIITAKRRPEPQVIERRLERRLSSVVHGDPVGPDGWTDPMTLWMPRDLFDSPAAV